MTEHSRGISQEIAVPAKPAVMVRRRMLPPMQEWFGRQTLSVQFLLASSVLILLVAGVSGYLISREVSQNAAGDRAAATALFMQSILEPVGNELAQTGEISPARRARLDQLFAEPQFKGRFPYFELWLPDATVAYSTSKELIGRRFNPPPGLVQALRGDVAADYADLTASEHTLRSLNARYLEIYSPVRRADTGEVVAVAEIHEDTDILHWEIFKVRLIGWTVVAGASTLIMLGLFGIVHRGSATIEQQRLRLQQRAEEAERVSEEIRVLRDRARIASLRMTDFNERLTRGIGADLHDGPAQLIGFAVLQMEPVRLARSKAERDEALDVIGRTLEETLKEIRLIARSLLLPDIERLELDQVIARATRLHEARTGTQVEVEASGSKLTLPPVIKTCVYRFVQEGLNNAYRHAGGQGQAVRCRVDGVTLVLSVSDSGRQSGDGHSAEKSGGGGLGIHGLQQRVESLGGTLNFIQRQSGAELKMTLDLGGGILDG
ncbi:ATP-binding protein [Ensifer sp. SSB1]|uniref:sensor histidine kinase n=1 Tax=Ensifer sp. SSB1 TaxID=2795385 RepID=UPI001A509E56|nr:ATP-binding protein [Ensifer sp. SSB1]MBK5566044.1 histidine kinase [Ensifer sp. SSB1]